MGSLYFRCFSIQTNKKYLANAREIRSGSEGVERIEIVTDYCLLALKSAMVKFKKL